jgi:MYXO-CTERM domain-containing protein
MRAIAAGLLVVVGCSTAERSGQNADDIINGATDTAHDATILLVALRPDGRVGTTCSGTLVAPNMILTAKHCVADTDKHAACTTEGDALEEGAVRADKKPSTLLVYTGRKAIQVSDDTSAAAARGKKIISESSKTFCDGDLAFVVLDRDVANPIAALRLKEPPQKGELLTAVGWGLTEVGKMPTTRRMRENVPILEIGPHADNELTKEGLGRSEFQVGEAFCSGDSGGPAFSAAGAVVGVVSRGGNGKEPAAGDNRALGCMGPDTDGTYTHLAFKGKLVADAFKAAGHTPIEESSLRDGGADAAVPDATAPITPLPDASPPPPPLTPPVPDGGAPKANGTACKNDDECSSKACSYDKCRAQCGGVATCATNEECVPSGLVKVCLPKGTVPPEAPPPAPTYTNYPAPKPPPPTATTTDERTTTSSATDPTLPVAEGPGADAPLPAPSASSSASPAPPKANVDSSGCSAAPAQAPRSIASALGFGLAVLALRRRRRPTL